MSEKDQRKFCFEGDILISLEGSSRRVCVSLSWLKKSKENVNNFLGFIHENCEIDTNACKITFEKIKILEKIEKIKIDSRCWIREEEELFKLIIYSREESKIDTLEKGKCIYEFFEEEFYSKKDYYERIMHVAKTEYFSRYNWSPQKEIAYLKFKNDLFPDPDLTKHIKNLEEWISSETRQKFKDDLLA